jgi:hypothetical protein
MRRSNIKHLLPLYIMVLIIIACTCSGTTTTLSITKQLESTNGTVLSGSPHKDIKLNMSMIEFCRELNTIT